MTITRRRLCSAAGCVVIAGISGCTGDSGASGDNDGASESNETSDADSNSNGDEWAWSGSLPVDSVVQHYDPSCGCCSAYADYLEANGLDVERAQTDDRTAVRRDLGVPADAASCHTVEVGSYLVEGHVPLEAVETLLEDQPDVDGVSIPGMPRHAPGMGSPGDEPLTVYSFTTAGDLEEYVDV